MINVLNVAQTGLKASQTQVENVMNNLANETTPGYKKRVVNISELDHSDSRATGRGVIVDDVTRVTNDYMYQNLIKENSKLTAYEQENSMLNDIEAIFAETDDVGLSADINRYFQSIENLRTSPQYTIYKNELKNDANELLNSLKQAYSEIEAKEKEAFGTTEDTVAKVNELLNTIGDISAKIINSNDTPLDLLDKRDALEQEISEYIDVEISRDVGYELKIGGVTAVRFDTNVHILELSENYIAQKDIYAKENLIPYESSLVDPTTWNGNNQEQQTIQIFGAATSDVDFLGTTLAGTSGDSASDIATAIAGDASIITNWNTNNPNNEIDTIAVDGSNNEKLVITYKATEGDVAVLAQASSNGIDFDMSQETIKGTTDGISYILDDKTTVSLTYGDTVSAPIGTTPETYENITIDASNVVRGLVAKINKTTDTENKITTYNGPYELDKDGQKILTNNPLHSDYDPLDPNKDRYLIIESNTEGEAGQFNGEILVYDNNTLNSDGDVVNNFVEKHSLISQAGVNDIHLEIFDEEVYMTGGTLKPLIDNIKTESGENKFTKYKEQLDMFAQKLSDYSSGYIEHSDQTYTFGVNASQESGESGKMIGINLFTGSDVDSLEFYEAGINVLTQDKLDYLADIQWNEDINFDGTNENNSSFSEYFQSIRAGIATDREAVRFNEESQAVIKESMQSNYDKIVKVDKDTEMVELIKYQAAYAANAKMITMVDEMLQTILGMKR
ncbi:MAG: flagellar basal body rod C-terminal domain-containing protein [Campylobacterota bacterium]|nr:flagellar basal body rod C-terminal domain-containing protein [Campylobacterota bacterium]